MARTKKGAPTRSTMKRSPARKAAPRRKSVSVEAVSEEERERMIAEAAYFRALGRGFHGGDPVADWLAAEREINRLLPPVTEQRQELAAYEKLRARVGAGLGAAREKLGADNIRMVLAQAVEQLKAAGEHTADTVDRVAATVEKDMVAAAQFIGSRAEAFSEHAADLFHVWKDRGGEFLGGATQALADWLKARREGARPVTYRTGEMASAGMLECISCGERLVLETAAHVPRCPRCHALEFRRR